MKLEKKLLSIMACAVSALLFSCASSQTGKSEDKLSSNVMGLVESAVFEVLIEKSKDDPITYEEELDWNVIPYSIRSDDYYSIGTAFAISRTELVTAFHVISLDNGSKVYDKYFIRDAKKNVYEIDQVVSGSNERDFLIFTVKDRVFDSYFTFDEITAPGTPVFSIGNALGEGIVVRNGLILGTVPEDESGRWQLLKSSADGNPGNSGGPLVTHDGKVVGVVTSLRDNILYSVPAEAVFGIKKNVLEYRFKTVYGHLILANNITRVFETQVTLPEGYKTVQETLISGFQEVYGGYMQELFQAAPAYLDGPNNMYLLNSVPYSDFPEIAFVDKNDNQWKMSDLKVNTYTLPDDGKIEQASVSEFNFVRIKKPRSVPMEKINTDPGYIMDLMLEHIRTDRTLWGNIKYRILSFGDPEDISEYKDAQGRTWIKTHWIIGFGDYVMIMYILPRPNGPALITSMQPSSRMEMYEWDMNVICDHVFTGYSGRYDEWGIFFDSTENIPDFLRDFSFGWQKTRREIQIAYPDVSFNLGSGVFDWTDSSELFTAPSWYKAGEQLKYGIRRMILSRDIRGRDYVSFLKNVKPDSRLGTNAMESWQDIVDGKFPLDGKPVISASENTGSSGMVIPAEKSTPDVRYSVYISIEDPQSEENIQNRLNTLEAGIKVNE